MSLSYLTACYILGTRYHSGQWSRGYSAFNIANQFALRDGISLGRIVEQLSKHSILQSRQFRSSVAYYLWRMKGSRTSL